MRAWLRAMDGTGGGVMGVVAELVAVVMSGCHGLVNGVMLPLIAWTGLG